MRRVDRVRVEKRRRLLVTAGLAFALGALTAGALIWPKSLTFVAHKHRATSHPD